MVVKPLLVRYNNHANSNKCSEESSSGLFEEFGGDQNSAKIAMEEFEISAVSKVGTEL